MATSTRPEVTNPEVPEIIPEALAPKTKTIQQQETQLLLDAWRAPRPQPRLPNTDRLFAHVLLETSGLEHRRRKVSAVISFILQCFAISLVILIPLWFTDSLPKQQLLTFLVAPPPPPPPPAAAPAARVVQRITSELSNGTLRSPVRIPTKIQIIREEEAPPMSGGVIGGVPGGIPGGQMGGVIGGILNSANLSGIPKLSAPPPPQRIRISQGVTKGQILQRVEAKYPPLALQARIQGVVQLKAIISKEGDIQNLELITGHPMLVPAAMNAVKQWRYRPFLLNGIPVEVETQVTVTFQISS